MVFVVGPIADVATQFQARVGAGVDVARLSSVTDAATMALGRPPELLVIDGEVHHRDTAGRVRMSG